MVRLGWRKKPMSAKIKEKQLTNVKKRTDIDLEDEEEKKVLWREIVASLPCGFCLGASMTTNYQQLKTIYFQRRFHKLKEWHIFCDMILSLPHFKEIVLKEQN